VSCQIVEDLAGAERDAADLGGAVADPDIVVLPTSTEEVV
jgi:hypothetical protein